MMDSSRANGPGVRSVIWLQGCTLACPGCFNPKSHSHEPRFLVPVETIIERITAIRDTVEGVTISGGEPFQQSRALLRLLAGLRGRTSLSVILFTGYSMQEALSVHHGDEIIKTVDVLIAGRFVRELRTAAGLRGSSNQVVHMETDRYRVHDIEQTPPAEISIDDRGMISVSGISPPHVPEAASAAPGGSRDRRTESTAGLEPDERH
ncbi:MAG: 4Fe-4S single cluster domain-containing protein [Desulfomonilaceae bacterium]|nr:4Fe-4S single cluster domain-containing protein [Desulfomonilaceae bacterium]